MRAAQAERYAAYELVMKQQTKLVLIYVVVLVMVHSLAVGAIYLEHIGYRNSYLLFFFAETSLRYAFIIVLPLLVPVLFGIAILSWRQYLLEVAITISVWQMTSLIGDWIVGRLRDPIWMKDMEGRWSSKILRLAVVPLILISIGALLGQLRKLRRFTVRPAA